MAFISIESTNPNLSFILRKNPSSGLLAKNLRKGAVFGWFSPDNNQKYNIFFKDADNDVSYKTKENEDFEYQNISRYNSSLFVTDAIYEFFDSSIKKPTPEDVLGFESKVTIYALETHPAYLNIFQRSFEGFDFEVNVLSPNNYKLEISTNRNIKDLFQFVSLFSIFNSIKTGSLMQYSPDENQVAKYIQNIVDLDAPYMIRYLFKLQFLRLSKIFKTYSKQLEVGSTPINLTFGSANDARIDFVKSNLTEKDLELDILDVGCGEGRYAFELARKLPDGTIYHAVDKDKELLESVERRAKFKEITNIATHLSLDLFLGTYNGSSINVLLVEVIEHMRIEEAQALVSKLLTLNVNKLLITTPNKAFSKHYAMDDNDLRHKDHHFEFESKEEFASFMPSLAGYDCVISGLGDTVDGLQPQFQAIITKVLT